MRKILMWSAYVILFASVAVALESLDRSQAAPEMTCTFKGKEKSVSPIFGIKSELGVWGCSDHEWFTDAYIHRTTRTAKVGDATRCRHLDLYAFTYRVSEFTLVCNDD